MMKYILPVLGWFFSVCFGLLAVSMFLMGNRLQGAALAAVFLLLFPPAGAWLRRVAGRSLPWWGRTVSVVFLLAAFAWLGSLNTFTSAIYKSAGVKAGILKLYDAKMKSWPVPYEDRFVDTGYGRVHVIVSGPEDGPPVVLLHASGVSSWSWCSNAGALNKRYRTFAVDTPGDAGKSELATRDRYPKDGRAQADLYKEITGKLGVARAYVVGASEGGFIGVNYALYAPERVRKLVLLGPMGFGGTIESVLRIMITQFFPLESIQESTIPWAFGSDPRVVNEFKDWFRLVLTGTFPRKARPVQFTAEQRRSITVPVLLVLGNRDNLVGDPERTRELSRDIPDARVEVLDAGHLMGVEQSERVNELITEFFSEPGQGDVSGKASNSRG